MIINLAHKHFDEKHLTEVVSEMEILGTPTIKCVDVGEGVYQAIEGCHRIRAAKQLGLTPIINIIPCDDTLICTLSDIDDNYLTVEMFCDKQYANSEQIEF